MITLWSISNFKSIRDSVALDFTPLTVFCGPNSSGKSALIKSILMVSQTLSSSAWEEPLILNGNFVHLVEDGVVTISRTSIFALGLTRRTH